MTVRQGRAGRLGAAIARHPREFTAIILAGLATATIFVNALFFQHGPHPAPIFALKPQARSRIVRRRCSRALLSSASFPSRSARPALSSAPHIAIRSPS